MDINQYAGQSRLPLKILRWMVAEKIIHDPLLEEDLLGLELLEKVWMRRDYLRAQLSQFSYQRRLKIIETADLKTKWERYAYSRLKNMPPKKNLKMNDLIGELELTFGFVFTPRNIKRLYKVKRKVYYRRQREKKY